MIYTSYYSMLRHIPANLQPFSISNGMPSGVALPKLHALIPTWGAVQEYKRSGDWETFKEQYVMRLHNTDFSQLLPLLKEGNIVLVCYEKDSSMCHRSILAEWLSEYLDLEVKEWQRDDN